MYSIHFQLEILTATFSLYVERRMFEITKAEHLLDVYYVDGDWSLLLIGVRLLNQATNVFFRDIDFQPAYYACQNIQLCRPIL